jgi:hypothetical protein
MPGWRRAHYQLFAVLVPRQLLPASMLHVYRVRLRMDEKREECISKLRLKSGSRCFLYFSYIFMFLYIV